jgi:hypothetical protein
LRKLFVAIGASAAAAIIGFFVYQDLNRQAYALEVDATKDTTDITGTMYRVRVTNVGTHELTGLIVTLGPGDVQHKSSLQPGETFFFYPRPDTQVSNVVIVTDQGLDVLQDYRSPMKTFGLPGSGR